MGQKERVEEAHTVSHTIGTVEGLTCDKTAKQVHMPQDISMRPSFTPKVTGSALGSGGQLVHGQVGEALLVTGSD